MDAREARLERRREQTRDEILEAARTVLLKKGLTKLTLSAVAREIQLTKAALYYYFPSKEAILFELIYEGVVKETEAVEAALENRVDDGTSALEILIRTLCAHHASQPDEIRLIYMHPQLNDAPKPFDETLVARVRPMNDRVYGRLAQAIDEDRETGRLGPGVPGRRLAFLAHTAVIGLMTVRGLVRRTDSAPLVHPDDALVDGLVQTFCGGATR